MWLAIAIPFVMVLGFVLFVVLWINTGLIVALLILAAMFAVAGALATRLKRRPGAG